MQRTMIRYRVKADRAAENERLIERVFEQLRERALPGLEYASFKLEDGVTFVHLVSSESEAARKALRALPAFDAFLAGLGERCEEGPVPAALHVVGSYGLFAE
jgi:hypothetical protein